MSDVAFAELEAQVDTLPMFQVIMLKNRLERRIEREQSAASVQEGLIWLESISGSVHRDIDYKKERAEWRDEKYGRAD